MACVTSDGQMSASTTSPLMSRTSHLRDLRQTGCDVMSVLVSQEADVLLANLAYGHDNIKSKIVFVTGLDRIRTYKVHTY